MPVDPANINERNSYGNTPLMLALTSYGPNSYDRFCELLSLGADVNLKNNYGYTPLHRACERAEGKFLIKILEQPNLVIDPKDHANRTPLVECCIQSRAPQVKLLLQAGANPNIVDTHGQTPLFKTRKVKIAKLLIKHGADINHTDTHGRTVLHYLCEFSIGAFRKLITYYVKAGIDVNITNYSGYTALECVSTSSKRDIPPSLLKAVNAITNVLDTLPPYNSPQLDRFNYLFTKLETSCLEEPVIDTIQTITNQETHNLNTIGTETFNVSTTIENTIDKMINSARQQYLDDNDQDENWEINPDTSDIINYNKFLSTSNNDVVTEIIEAEIIDEVSLLDDFIVCDDNNVNIEELPAPKPSLLSFLNW